MSKSLFIFDEPTNLKRLSEMIFVKSGTFRMGDDEKDKHLVKLDSFCIGKYPVAQALWKAVMNGANPAHFISDNHPVERVSWDDITKITVGFLDRLNEMTIDARPKDSFYRLPTEAQWEYTVKGGKYGNDFLFIYSGSNKLNEVGWYDENSHRETKPVGLKIPNFLGIHDMSGNVSEWCNDWYGSHQEVIKQTEKDQKTGAILNPMGVEEGHLRVRRGGNFMNNARGCHFIFPFGNLPSHRSYDIGFRLVLVIPKLK